MSKTIAILQSNYIPWKGYFDLIDQVDEFVLYDEVQYTYSDWRNRNRIKAPHGSMWLTIPIQRRHRQTIKDARVCHDFWRVDHWKTIGQYYSRAPFYAAYKDFLEDAYCRPRHQYLSEINYEWIRAICRQLSIATPITWSTSYPRAARDRTERLIEICRQARADVYLTGPAARGYLNTSLFCQAGIGVRYIDYTYPCYDQLFPPYDPFVSVLDLLLMNGDQAIDFMKPMARKPKTHEVPAYC